MNNANPVSKTITRHLRITGRVQGVGYRWNMAQQAQSLGVSGWVRNRLNGSVEAVVSGPSSAVEALVDWAQRGPSGARVDGVVTDIAGEGLLGEFDQRETV